MKHNDALFDIKMKQKFKEELREMPPAVDDAFESSLNFIKNQGDEIMRKPFKIKKAVVAAISAACILLITMQTTFAQDFVNKVLKSLSLNNITIFENEPFEWKDRIVPEAAKGKVFDKDGHVVKTITFKNQDALFTADGARIFGVEDDGTLLTQEVLDQMNSEESLIVKETDKLNEYARFDVKLPAYLPAGYAFSYAEFFKDDTGKIIDDGCSLTFVNSKNDEKIYIDESYISEETKSETSFENIESVKVNGNKAIVGDEGIVWEAGEVSYLMYTYDLGKAESVKIAESIK